MNFIYCQQTKAKKVQSIDRKKKLHIKYEIAMCRSTQKQMRRTEFTEVKIHGV